MLYSLGINRRFFLPRVIGIVLNHLQVPEGLQFLAWLAALLIYLAVVKSLRFAGIDRRVASTW